MEQFFVSLWILSGASTVLLFIGSLIVMAVVCIIGIYVLPGLLVRWIARATSQRGSRGEAIALTPMARLTVANPGWVAGLGKNATPQHSLNEIIMRPTIGFRLITVGVTAALVMLMVTDGDQMFAGNRFLMAGMWALGGYYFICMNMYFLRYDREGFITQDWLFRRKEVGWRHVIDLKDNGQYQYVLTLENGKKVEIQKYLVGMPDFLTYAKDQIAYHNRP